MREPQVHDLIRIDPAIAVGWNPPAWVEAALARAPWVVVRRACAADTIPVGVRGATREQRFAAQLGATAVRELVAPADLIGAGMCGEHRLARAARAVDAAARELDISWGIAGAYGFELATGRATTHGGSDLDIVAGGGPTRAALCLFDAHRTRIERTTGVRIDADVLYASAGIALAELVSNAPCVLAKTARGPRLIVAPL